MRTKQKIGCNIGTVKKRIMETHVAQKVRGTGYTIHTFYSYLHITGYNGRVISTPPREVPVPIAAVLKNINPQELVVDKVPQPQQWLFLLV